MAKIIVLYGLMVFFNKLPHPQPFNVPACFRYRVRGQEKQQDGPVDDKGGRHDSDGFHLPGHCRRDLEDQVSDKEVIRQEHKFLRPTHRPTDQSTDQQTDRDRWTGRVTGKLISNNAHRQAYDSSSP